MLYVKCYISYIIHLNIGKSIRVKNKCHFYYKPDTADLMIKGLSSDYW